MGAAVDGDAEAVPVPVPEGTPAPEFTWLAM